MLEPILVGAKKPGSLIPMLQKTQDLYGYLPVEALVAISEASRIPLSKIYGVVTFYAQFSLEPKGRHLIRVCRGTACHVRGGKSALTMAKRVLGIEDGETTPDMQFTLETVACLGACALAPVAVVDGTYYGKITAQRLEKIIRRVRDEEQ
ncbi:MAG: NAD(P)H-dependent oxidoreductase subunit E [Actinobacteria bacterium]|nr:MAG: NAD(P)H-dependent oxidoreductase subunit E [Actinomycetota bacterium]